jgi:hypothetical protein
VASLRRCVDEYAVAEWQRLTLEWDSAYASYKAAVEASPASPLVKDDHREQGAAIERAISRLTEIKREMDILIAEGKRRRGSTAEPLVVGLIELGPSPVIPTMPARRSTIRGDD